MLPIVIRLMCTTYSTAYISESSIFAFGTLDDNLTLETRAIVQTMTLATYHTLKNIDPTSNHRSPVQCYINIASS